MDWPIAQGRADQAEGTAEHKEGAKARKVHWTQWPEKRMWVSGKAKHENGASSGGQNRRLMVSLSPIEPRPRGKQVPAPFSTCRPGEPPPCLCDDSECGEHHPPFLDKQQLIFQALPISPRTCPIPRHPQQPPGTSSTPSLGVYLSVCPFCTVMRGLKEESACYLFLSLRANQAQCLAQSQCSINGAVIQ